MLGFLVQGSRCGAALRHWKKVVTWMMCTCCHCRVQVWQWVRYGAKLDTGKVVTAELVRKVVDEEMQAARQQLGDDR